MLPGYQWKWYAMLPLKLIWEKLEVNHDLKKNNKQNESISYTATVSWKSDKWQVLWLSLMHPYFLRCEGKGYRSAHLDLLGGVINGSVRQVWAAVSPAGNGGAGNCLQNFCCLSLPLGIYVSFCQLSVVMIMTWDLHIYVYQAPKMELRCGVSVQALQATYGLEFPNDLC